MPLQVLFTIDTEVYAIDKNCRSDHLALDVRRDFYGDTKCGSFGIPYQLEVFKRYGLKAVFFIEGLHASCDWVGISPLKDLVQLIYSYGQEIQLHLHPEWVPHASGLRVPDRGHLLTSYTEDEQYRIIDTGINNLVRAGAESPIAFRAGDYAANADTLHALKRTGLIYDTSYNFPFLSNECKLEFPRLWQPAFLAPGVWEVPISCFEERKRAFRHCQLCACSAGEIVNAIRDAAGASWQSFVLVSHSFEMLGNRRSTRPVWPRWQVIKRFENECQWLASNRQLATTAHFLELHLVGGASGPALSGHFGNRIWRNLEQAADRITSRLEI